MKKAYTLVELVMAMVVLGVVAAIGAVALLETGNAWSFSSGFQNFAVQSAIVTMNRMDKDMRNLKDDSSVTTATSSQYAFTNLNSVAISYSLSGNTLMRNSDGLADNITSLSFTYYDDDGNTIAVPTVSPNNTNIRRITVNFSILAGTNTLNFQFQTRLQNLEREGERFK